MGRYVLAIDQGTTGNTAVLLDHDLRIAGRATLEFPQYYPQPGWVEHEPDEIWSSCTRVIGEALHNAGARAEEIAAIGITNQRETVVLWNRDDGNAVGRAIVWQDRRTASICSELRGDDLEPLVREKTGLVIDPYFSGTKLTWVFRNRPDLRQAAEAGRLCFGTVDSFLTWRLTGGAVHVTDVSNASRTLLLDIRQLRWDPELCRHFEVPMGILPEVRSSSEVYGHTRNVPGLPDGIPVSGMAGDQQAALFGQVCFEAGQAKCTYGTGAFLVLNTGSEVVLSKRQLLSTVAWRLSGKTTYALEGSCFIAGAAVQWLRDGLGIIQSSAEVEALAASVPDSGGVVFVPALSGLGAPHWRPEARGLVSGITRGTTAAHLARATLEGIAFQVHDLAVAMREDSGHRLDGLRVDGGACHNELLMQFQADLLGVEIVRPEMTETTALGAALLAGLAVGHWGSAEEIASIWREERRFKPSLDPEETASRLQRWRDAVTKA